MMPALKTGTLARGGRRIGGRGLRSVLAPAALAFAAATVLAACGGGSGDNGSANSGGGGGNAGSGSGVVSLHSGSGMGKVLVDKSGKTLYFSDEEKSGKTACTGSCLGFWFPLTVSGQTVAGPTGLPGKLGTMKRTDNGKLQVTYNGAPLYTFKLDSSSGDMKGNNFSDSFGSTHFTWHAASTTKSSSTPKSSSSSSDGGGGYGNY